MEKSLVFWYVVSKSNALSDCKEHIWFDTLEDATNWIKERLESDKPVIWQDIKLTETLYANRDKKE